jgi:predicted AlkP superfamily phosphohydrolase/phosphomutase
MCVFRIDKFMKKKLFFIGIDGATWDLIIPWMKKGLLPGFEKLWNKGSNYKMKSTIPPHTSAAWPTMLTGATPAEHGHYSFWHFKKNGDKELNDTTNLKQKYFWESASEQGKKVCIYNIPTTYPVRPINGFIISGFDSPGEDSDFIYPKQFRKKFFKQFPDYKILALGKFHKNDKDSQYDFFIKILKNIKQKIRVSKWLFEQDKWDVFVTNVQEIDHTQHFYWKNMDDENSILKNAILLLYQEMDLYLNEVIDKYSDKYEIVLASDHGFGESTGIFYMNKWLEDNGYLVFKNTSEIWIKKILRHNLLRPQFLMWLSSKLKLNKSLQKVNKGTENKLVGKIFLDITDINWKKTKAYAYGEYGGIFVVDKKNKEALKKEIINKLKKDLGRKISLLKSSDKIYGKKNYDEKIPDIQYLIENGAKTMTTEYFLAGGKVFDTSITGTNGSHRINGVLSIYGGKKNNRKLKKCKIYDVFPTLMSILNIKYHVKIRGKDLYSKKSIVDEIII